LTTISHDQVSNIGVSPGRDRKGSSFAVGQRPNSERAYRRAVRHSRVVRTLRVTIPLMVVLGCAGAVVIATWLNPLRALARLPIDANGLVVSGTKITMKQPRMAGFTRDARPYLVTARGATQDLLEPDTLELDNLHSVLELQDKSKFDVTAKRGVYDTKNEKLTLQTDVVIVTAHYRALLSDAFVNMRTSYMLTERPVEVQMQQGTINANRMELLNSGEIIRFERGVTMVVRPNTNIAQAAGRTEAQ
jgi:lipopolysaccharide export system protein LptC